MEILQVVGIGLVGTVLMVILKQQKPEIPIQLSVVIGIVIFLFMLGKISTVIQVMEDLAQRAGVDRYYLATILKVVGITYIGEFGAQICRDAGENAVAAKVEFATKILIIVLALPIVVALLETIIRLLP